jgi:membrane-bound metal-dependent hydrolase YbcI (DUF457 family)
MALAVTHIIGTLFILDIFRHYIFGRRKFSRRLLLIGGLAGILPDIDIPISWLINSLTGKGLSLHGAFTHSLFWPLLLIGIGFILFYYEKKTAAKVLWVISAGLFIHTILDCLFNSYETFLWPLKFNTQRFCPSGLQTIYRAGVDAIILVAWLIHEEWHNKIKDYW